MSANLFPTYRFSGAKANGVKRAATGPAANATKFKKAKTPSSGSATPSKHTATGFFLL